MRGYFPNRTRQQIDPDLKGFSALSQVGQILARLAAIFVGKTYLKNLRKSLHSRAKACPPPGQSYYTLRTPEPPRCILCLIVFELSVFICLASPSSTCLCNLKAYVVALPSIEIPWISRPLPMAHCQPLKDIVSYNAAISACEKTSAWWQAFILLNTLEEYELQADAISFSIEVLH